MAKYRKPGQWIEIAKARSKVERVNRTSRGLTNIPNMNEAGSAAYRRMNKKKK